MEIPLKFIKGKIVCYFGVLFCACMTSHIEVCTAVNCNNYVKCNTNVKCNNLLMWNVIIDVKCVSRELETAVAEKSHIFVKHSTQPYSTQICSTP